LQENESMPTRVSAIIIARDEAHCIAGCLDSLVSVADEIIVVDSGSTDGTPDIARSYGAQVHHADWPGFGAQKNRALSLATGDWVLSIDADERVTPSLAESIQSVIELDAAAKNGYYIRFLPTWVGKPMRYGDWGGKRHLRFFRRDCARFTNDCIHERVLCNAPHGMLNGIMLHHTITSEDQAIEKCRYYAELSAMRLHKRGKGGTRPACIHAGWTLFRGLVLKAGVLDGIAGWKVAIACTRGTWLRYRIAGRLAKSTAAPKDNAHVGDTAKWLKNSMPFL
jgi:glycosyltransferase involved in cell wall biosynthesis